MNANVADTSKREGIKETLNYRQPLAQCSTVVMNNLRNPPFSTHIEYKYTLQHITRESASHIVRISESFQQVTKLSEHLIDSTNTWRYFSSNILRINEAHFKLFQSRKIVPESLLSYRKEEKHQYKYTTVEKKVHCSRIFPQETKDLGSEFVHYTEVTLCRSLENQYFDT